MDTLVRKAGGEHECSVFAEPLPVGAGEERLAEAAEEVRRAMFILFLFPCRSAMCCCVLWFAVV